MHGYTSNRTSSLLGAVTWFYGIVVHGYAQTEGKDAVLVSIDRGPSPDGTLNFNEDDLTGLSKDDILNVIYRICSSIIREIDDENRNEIRVVSPPVA